MLTGNIQSKFDDAICYMQFNDLKSVYLEFLLKDPIP